MEYDANMIHVVVNCALEQEEESCSDDNNRDILDEAGNKNAMDRL